MEGDTPVVVRTLPGGPCDLAGVHGGDRIVSIDDAPTAGEGLGTIVMHLRGVPGSQVALRLQRGASLRVLVVQRQPMRRTAEDYTP